MILLRTLVEFSETAPVQRLVVGIVDVVLLEIGEHERQPGDPRQGGHPVRPIARREDQVDVVEVVQGDAELLQVVDALRAAGRLARRLHGRQQQGDQDGDDRDHHQQLDQRETMT